MKTELLLIDADTPEESKIEKAVSILEAGGIAAVPTETVYGLAAYSGNKEALHKLYKVKSRDKGKPITVQLADSMQLKDYLDKIPARLSKITDRFWPGPLTVVLDTKRGTLGFRVPANSVTLAILKKASAPLFVTSANISGKKDLTSAKDVMQEFNSKIELVIDDGTKTQGIASTVLDCTTKPWRVLRTGKIANQLRKLIEK
jgi:L-threonylcarbamoyladenylate synthase